MSYNIDTAAFSGESTLTIGGADVRDIAERFADDLPESCFIRRILRNTRGRNMGVDVPGLRLDDATEYPIEAVEFWRGEWSGHSFDTLVNDILPVTSGAADIVLTWEGGDSFSGLRVRDGKVTRHKAVMVLGEEEK